MKKQRFISYILLISGFLLMSHACEKKETAPTTDQPTSSTDLPLEKIKYTFTGDYTDLWNKVDSLQKKGLYQSALDVVEVIYVNAKSSENTPQIIKAVIHKIKYNSYIKEDDYIIAINDLTALTQTEKFPLKQLIHSITADVYWKYYSQNRWKFIQRTTTVDFENSDIRTWDLTHLLDQTNKHYLASLSEEQKLQAVDLLDFKEILLNTDEVSNLQPTLYDFLAQRAFDYFKNTESSITRPADKFVVAGKEYFGSDEAFLNLELPQNDSLSNHLYAVQILKNLTRFHAKDTKPETKVEIVLQRLQFANQNCKDEQKSEWYITALNQLATKYITNEVYVEITYYRALYHTTKGNEYSINQPDSKWEIKKAHDLCSEAILKFPKSFGAKKCISLKESIESKSISFSTETAYIPNQKGKILVNYTNVDSLYFRVFKAKSNAFSKDQLYGDELIKKMLSYSIVHEWSMKIEDPKDFQKHTTEIVIPENELGHYFILASANKNFSLDNNSINHAPFWVTNLSYSDRSNQDGSMSVQVADRLSGKPLAGVKGTVYTQKYNYTSRQYDYKAQESYTSDKKGLFTVSKHDYRSFYIELKNGKDEYNDVNQHYQYNGRISSQPYATTTFFTDRQIYRPGQTVYFKGIKINHSGESHTLITNQKTTVTFYDVNSQKIADLEVTTNEYGTFSGSFTAPNSGLNGRMSLNEKNGNYSFSVEEYKRPKFEVAFKPVSGSFKLGQEINVSGNAKSYAGSTIDGAKVQYRITRSSYFPRWAYYRWGYYPFSSSDVEIKNGETTTDDLGDFVITFKANEDPSIDKKYSPNYSYTITADITDATGETRFTSETVSVGYSAMNLSLSVSDKIDVNSKQNYIVSTTNLNGQKVGAKGKVTITELIEPNRIYRPSLWEKPDIQQIKPIDYATLFPYDEYDNELDVSKFKKGAQILMREFNTANKDSIQLSELKSTKTGRYMIETTAIDTFGTEVKDIQYVVLYNPKESKIATNELWSSMELTSSREPGEVASFLIGSAAEYASVLYEIEHKGKTVHSEIIELSKEQKIIKLPINESHRGNVTVHFSMVKFGRSFSNSYTVYVPFSNKELDVKFETFRDKLLPGAKEEWKLRISGPKGEKVAAELLIGMYDASLDMMAANSFYLNPYQSFYSSGSRQTNSFSTTNSQNYEQTWNKYTSSPEHTYPLLNWFGFNSYSYGYDEDFYDYSRGESTISYQEIARSPAKFDKDKRSKGGIYSNAVAPPIVASGAVSEFKSAEETSDGLLEDSKPKENQLGDIQARSNLNETAFFFPQLETDANGDVIFKFTMPEALTRWKLIGLAHTKDLKIGSFQKEVVTQKELMVQPNAPRFFREGDDLVFSAKISNLAEEDLTGSAQLFLFDAATMEPMDNLFKNTVSTQSFEVKKGLSTAVTWKINVPEGIGAVTYRVVAKAKNHTDGEEMVIPVLSNRILVTESIPLPSKGIGTKNFYFTKLIESANSKTIKHHKVTLEYTSNPAWYAIQAMPYMMEYPYECAEQTFTRYYSNAIASNIINSRPKIKQVFESWKTSSPDAFLSNLQKNQDLKSVMLEETPWVLDAKDESERKKRVALLFDLNKMDNELNANIRKLEKMQVSNGGWPWFPGMPESRYITQHIVTGMGHLDHLTIKNVREDKRVWKMVENGVEYLDARLVDDLNWLKKYSPNYKNEQHISELQIQYLYARSYFGDIEMNKATKEAYDYYSLQAQKYWTSFTIYNQGMIALQAKRYNQPVLANDVIKSLKERLLKDDELGMYWKDNVSGYYWYQAPIETQALMIEAFDEVADDQETVEELKVWLLKQKQTTDWKTTKATAEACYALLLKGTDILENAEQVEISVAGSLLDPKKLGSPVEAGTGYFKTSWSGKDVKPELGNISVTRKTQGVSWGAMYWQYFEDIDKVTTHETNLKLSKKLFLVKNTASGPVMTPITSSTKLLPGDKVRVRIELRTDRNMEYVHMKDMRAAGFEPINIISNYKYQGGLGYYESTKDAATHFFFDYIPKGTYVFEYDLRTSHSGNFSNGIATLECMYAPEFTTHSEGLRVKID